MKKMICLSILFLAFTSSAFARTWTVVADYNKTFYYYDIPANTEEEARQIGKERAADAFKRLQTPGRRYPGGAIIKDIFENYQSPWKVVLQSALTNKLLTFNVTATMYDEAVSIARAQGGWNRSERLRDINVVSCDRTAPRPAKRDDAADMYPIQAGVTLVWQVQQKGKMVVTSVSGNKFYIDQTNDTYPSAGITKLEGEVKDGKIYFYNKKFNETWVGTRNSSNVIIGMVNGQLPFSIWK